MLDLAIIGGGPAGLSAGLYATRGGLKNVVMFEKGEPGGQITSSSEIENYPGQKAPGESGFDFMSTWWKQCSAFGLVHKWANVVGVRKNSDGSFEILLEGGKSEQAKAVIVATGSTPRRAGFKGEDEFFGKGALYLANICSKVYLIHRRDEFRAAPTTVEKARKNEKIEFITSATVKEALGDKMGLTKIVLDTKNGERVLDVPGIFTFVGLNVNNEILKDENGKFICEMADGGQVKTNLKMQTSLKGLFVAGDIREDAPKQVIVAAGDGAVAALSAMSYIESLH